MWIRTHAAFTLRSKFCKFSNQLPISIEHLFRAITLQPFFENRQVLRLIQIGYRHLTRAPRALDLFAVHKFRSWPTLRSTQNDHRPDRSHGRFSAARFTLHGVTVIDDRV